MPLNEADTRAKLIDPALLKAGWPEDWIRREQTPGPFLRFGAEYLRVVADRYIDIAGYIPELTGR